MGQLSIFSLALLGALIIAQCRGQKRPLTREPENSTESTNVQAPNLTREGRPANTGEPLGLARFLMNHENYSSGVLDRSRPYRARPVNRPQQQWIVPSRTSQLSTNSPIRQFSKARRQEQPVTRGESSLVSSFLNDSPEDTSTSSSDGELEDYLVEPPQKRQRRGDQ